MADFRKVSVLVALVLMLGLTAGAQTTSPLSCTGNAAVPPTVRAEGYTELVGDIVLDCTGGTATAVPADGKPNVSQINFTIYLNTNVTSRTYGSLGLSEAILLIDEPTTLVGCGNNNGCTMVGNGGVSEIYGTSGRPNVFRGIVSGNTVQFIGVPVDPPGSTGHRIFRFTNIRANASGISSSSSSTPGTLQALISASGTTSLPMTNTSLVVGYVQSGLTFNYRKRSDTTGSPNTSTDIQFPQCNSLSRTATNSSFILQFTENFPTAFKIRATGTTAPGTAPAVAQATPGAIYNTESGFFTTSPITGTGAAFDASVGLADSGTRLKAVFNNIPTGTTVYVSNYLFASTTGTNGNTNSNVGQLLTGEVGIVGGQTATYTDMACNASGQCPFGGTDTTHAAAYQLPVVNGSATAVWEVTTSNGLAADNYNALVWFGYSANAASNSPAPGTGTITGGFAPTPSGLGVSASTAASTSTTLTVPRFVEGSSTKTAYIVYTCRTNLLFPFVTNQAGFDTGIAIANTSSDPFGTSAQNGSCTIYSYGDNAPASLSTGAINAGKMYVNLASTAMPNFQGYLIAQCGFQFAHGFAFVSDFGARNLAMGYLSLVIPEPGTGSRSAAFPASSAGLGEQLSN